MTVLRVLSVFSIAIVTASCNLVRVTGPSTTAPSATIHASIAQLFIGRFDTALQGLSREITAADAPASPKNLTAVVVGTTVTLTWTEGVGAATYVLEAGSASGLANLAIFDTGSVTTSFTAAQVAPGTYYVRVRARNVVGFSAPANEVVVVVGGGPCASPNPPTGLTVNVSGNVVTLAWQGPTGGSAPTSYVLEVGPASGTSNLFNQDIGLTLTISGTVSSGTYFARLRSTNACAVSGVSVEVPFTVG